MPKQNCNTCKYYYKGWCMKRLLYSKEDDGCRCTMIGHYEDCPDYKSVEEVDE